MGGLLFRRLRIVIALLVVIGSTAVVTSRHTTPANASVNEVVSVGARCKKKFATRGTKQMCLPSGRGKSLSWQRYPKRGAPCPRKGIKVPNPAFECVWMTTTGSIRHARNMWMPPRPLFTYRGVYGDEWQPKIGHECLVPRVTLEQSIFQGSLRGLWATCLLDARGVTWIWKAGFPSKNKPCSPIGFAYAKLVCTRVGKAGKWRPNARDNFDKSALLNEIFTTISRQTSRAHESWIDQLNLFFPANMSLESGLVAEIINRASAAGIKVKMKINEDGIFSIQADGKTTCYQAPDSINYLAEQVWNWWGSIRDIRVVDCDRTFESVKIRILSALTELETKLRTTENIDEHSAGLMSLRNSLTPVVTGSKVIPIDWRFTTDGSNAITSSSYRLNSTTLWPGEVSKALCYSATWNGTIAQLAEVSCA